MTLDTAIFDMDGTLVNSRELSVLAAQNGAKRFYEAMGISPEIPTLEKIQSSIGMPSLEYFRGLLPPNLAKEASKLRDFVVEEETALIEQGYCRLFEGATWVLADLQARGIQLGLVTNCDHDYLNTTIDTFGIRCYFQAIYCIGDIVQGSKIDLVKMALAKLSPKSAKSAIIVGDRLYDMEAGRFHGLYCIGCLYGYGSREELATADILIHDIREIPECLSRFETKTQKI